MSALEYLDIIQPKFLSSEFLSDYAQRPAPFSTDLGLIVFLRTYSRFIPELKRRERWWETVARVIDYSLSLYQGPTTFEALKAEAEELYDYVFNLKLFPAGRSLWAGGTEVVKKFGEANFNCSFRAIDSLEAYPEMFYLLMVGAGAGFSVEQKYVNQLPVLNHTFAVDHKPYQPVPAGMRIEFTEVTISKDYFGMFAPIESKHLTLDKEALVDESYTAVRDAITSFEAPVKVVIKIGDSKEGWAGALKVFLQALTAPNVSSFSFNYNFVRPENERLLTMGGRSSGPSPLRKLFEKITWIVKKAKGHLSSTDAMDIGNAIAEIVVVGGVRRSSELGLGDADDLAFIEAKFQLWSGANLSDEQVETLVQLLRASNKIVDRTKLAEDLAKKKAKEPWLVGTPLDLIFNQFEGGNHPFLWTGNYPEIEAFVDAHDPKYRYRASRVMSNNSVHLYENPGKEGLKAIFSRMENNGEPGIYIAENAMKRRPNYAGTNPCAEILLANAGVCNLSEVNVHAFVKGLDNFDYVGFKRAVQLATRMGSRITNISMWHPRWNGVQKRDRLLGVSLTGQVEAWDALGWGYSADAEGYHYFGDERINQVLKEVNLVARTEADRYHDEMGIPRALLVTTGKPSGCRPWDALTTTNKGILTLEELFEEHPANAVWAETKSYLAINDGENNQITKTYNNGEALVHNIKLSFGHRLQSTGNHQWFVKERRLRFKNNRTKGWEAVNQWVKTEDLQIGDVVDVKINTYVNQEEADLKSMNRLSISMRGDSSVIKEPSAMNPDIAWLIGYLWGDGSMSPAKFRIRFNDEYLFNLEKVNKILQDQFGIAGEIKPLSDRNAYSLEVGSKHLWHWLIKNDVWKYYNDQLDLIPRVIRCSSRESIIAFIAGLVDSDGCLYLRNKSRKTITIATAYDLFAHHLHQVALAVGLSFGKSLNAHGRNKQNNKRVWLLYLNQYTDSDSLSLLCKHSAKINNCTPEIANYPWVHESANRSLKKLGEVISVEEAGLMPTFDVEVENSHWYYAGAFKSHNTIAQLPTVSSGCHRAYAPYYLRRIRVSKVDPVAKALRDLGVPCVPENNQGEDLDAEICNTWVFTFPIKTAAPIRAIDERAVDQLERYKSLMQNYIDHNQSITVTVKGADYDENWNPIPGTSEWEEVVDWLAQPDNWASTIGVSFLPRWDPSENISAYPNLPYQPSTELEYANLSAQFQIKEAELVALISKYEQEYEEADLGSDCTSGGCPIR